MLENDFSPGCMHRQTMPYPTIFQRQTGLAKSFLQALVTGIVTNHK